MALEERTHEGEDPMDSGVRVNSHQYTLIAVLTVSSPRRLKIADDMVLS